MQIFLNDSCCQFMLNKIIIAQLKTLNTQNLIKLIYYNLTHYQRVNSFFNQNTIITLKRSFKNE